MDEGPRLRRDRTGDAGLVSLVRAGDPSAFGILVDDWADPLYDRLSHRGFTTADALDLSVAAFAEAYRLLPASTDPFGVQVLRAARLQAAAADERRVDLYLAIGPFAGDRLTHGTDAKVLASEEPVATFLMETASQLGPSASEVLDLRERHGFDDPEIAALLGVPVDAVADLAVSTPDALRELVGVRLVWRQGTPTCAVLAASLARHTQLEAGTRRAILEHLRGCEACRAAANPALDPVVVLAAIPLLVAPAGFKPALVEALARVDLPVSGSVVYRLPARSRGMAASDPPPPSPPRQLDLVATPPTSLDAPGGEPADPVSAGARPRLRLAHAEPELAALVIDDHDPSAPPPSATPAPTAAEERMDADDPADTAAARAAAWLADDPADPAPAADGAQLAPPPPPDAPTPVVPSFEVPVYSTISRGEATPAPKRRRWFRFVEA